MIVRALSPLLPLLLLAFSPGFVSAEPSTFEEVTRIFGTRCLHCHNDVDREGDFSVESQTSLRESGFVEPHDVDGSHLLSVLVGDDDRPSMPKDGEPLTDEEVRTIAEWIRSGAPWPENVRITDAVNDFDWWSFRPIEHPSVPEVDSDWVRTPIDAFIADKHRELGLSPAPPADRRTLIRRLTYDLIGLPPTPAEIEAFVNDDSDRAYENLVDRLLSSRHYGERWARHWLDVVKYADTCGYDKDKLRPNAWPYRDYVIRSFNQDKPYGRFVQEQIAGDVLFPGEPDGILGLGFLAAGPWDFIGHVEVAESKIDGKVARHLDRDEMVSNTLNTFCSVTVQCARCHDHKFDPFTQEHYYSLQSVFAAVDRAERAYDLDPAIEQQRNELQSSLQTAQASLKALEEELAEAGGEELVELDKRIKELESRAGVEKTAAYGYHSQIASSADQVKWVEVDLGDVFQIDQVILYPAHDEFAGIGAGFGFPPIYEVSFRLTKDADPHVIHQVDRDRPDLRHLPQQLEFEAPPKARFVRVTATKLAERKNDFIFALAEMAVFEGDKNLTKNATVQALDSIEAPVRWAKQNLIDGDWPKPADLEAGDALQLAKETRAEIWNRTLTPDRKQARQRLNEQIAQTKKSLSELPTGRLVYAAATEFKPQGKFQPTEGKPRPIFVLHRGDVEHPLDPVGPGRIPLSADDHWQLDANSEAERRAAIAQWLTHPDHPLVWRSIVNRVWQYHFGEGLVSTPNDFGRMGALPTHPELLDWMAAEFRDGDQSFKQLHRLIVTSSVYRQSSTHHSNHASIDGDNRYLWRMNRRRLTAEEIRDSILAVSGSLDTKMGGPGFYLFKLEKTEHSPHYEYHKFDPADPNSHRRSVYRFIVRSQPDPFMTTLDCADSSQSTPKRLETLTSLQALSLLNNRFNLEMSRRFAERLETETDVLEDQVNRAFILVTGRQPSSSESQDLAEYARQHGLNNMCRVLFNLSEFVFID